MTAVLNSLGTAVFSKESEKTDMFDRVINCGGTNMNDIRIIIAIYLGIVNIIGFILMGVDKSKAKRRKWRIPEATLFLVAAIGGSVGSIIGMYTFRHKTKHWYFVVRMPVILLIQVVVLLLVFFSPMDLIFL